MKTFRQKTDPGIKQAGEKDPRSFGGQTDRQTDRQTDEAA